MLGLVIVAIVFCVAAIGQEFYQGPAPKELPPSEVGPETKA